MSARKGVSSISGRRRFGRDENGAITIEFVLMFPLLLAGLAFSFEFGRLFVAHHTAVNNMRAAVRYLSRTDLSNAAQANAENLVRFGNLTGTAQDGNPINWVTFDSVNVNTSYATYSDTNFIFDGNTIRITAIMNFQPLLFGLTGQGNGVIQFGLAEDMRHAGA